MIPPQSFVLLGYSGGADSTCLLHLLKRAGIDIAAGHLHHGQRPEADTELRLCEAFCQELDVPFVSGRADVPRMSSELKIGLEEAGRHARYNFLQNASYRLQADLIATAHTRNDQAETVILNLCRGSGLHGLAGIPPSRDNIVRPLLPFTREETRSYCQEHGLWFHDDPANEDLSFSRARIRHRILPELAFINPKVDDAIARLAQLADEEDRFLNGMAASVLEQTEQTLNGDLNFLTSSIELALHTDKIKTLPTTLMKRAVRLATKFLGGALDFHQTETLVQSIQEGGNGSLTGEGGKVVVEWDERTIHLRQLEDVAAFRFPLTLPGETFGEEFGWVITAVRADTGERNLRASLQATLNADKVVGQLYFRSVSPGDKLNPIGFDGHRKVSDLMSDRKLSRAARQRLPIICDMLGPLWLPGVCLDQRAAADPGEGNVIRLRFSPIIERQRA